jgi:ribulose-5-phosphate 4-epimerase/fuculose-1-phosphate aldolase
MSSAVADLRIDLAAALRWAARLGLHEGICNHFSAAVDETGDRFLVNPWGWHWSEITASSLVLCDSRGKVLEGSNKVEDTAFHIHSRIHLKAPQARCVLHTHMPYALALCTVEGGRLEMCEQNAIRFYDRIAYDDDYNGVALSNDEGDRLAAALGNRSIAFLASHGVIVAGPSVALAFDDLYYLERACTAQVLARSTGLPLRRIDPKTVADTARQMLREHGQAARHFAALKRVLDREEPEYRN